MNRILAVLLITALTASTWVATLSRAKNAAQEPRAANASARHAAIVATTAEVLKETSGIRELAVLRPIKSGAQSREAIERMLIRNLDSQTTAEDMHANEVALLKFGLVNEDFQYRPFIIKLLTEQVAGYYDLKAQEFFLADWLEIEGQKPVIAHELTHALQDQHFDLRRFEKWPKGQSDAELAAHALVEGDATLAMTIYMAKNPLVALAFTKSILSTGLATKEINEAPRALRETLVFPYMAGSEWATQLYRRGGWKTISEAFTKLPLSTEQIIHPEKYFEYERPTKIDLTDLTRFLNSDGRSAAASAGKVTPEQIKCIGDVRQPRPASNRPTGSPALPTTNCPPVTAPWRLIDYDVNGEWGYYLILDQFLASAGESKRAAAGWAGDRYAIYEGPRKQDVLLVQMTAWDTETDAREFFDAYVKRTNKRYPAAKAVAEPATSPIDSRRWQTVGGSVIVQVRGRQVLIVEGGPDRLDANALVSLLWN